MLAAGAFLFLSGSAGLPSAQAQTYGIHRELWTNLPVAASNSLNVLTNAALNLDWPTNPAASFTKIYTNFETEAATGMTNYGQRLRAFIWPASNGFFRFTIASDDTSQLSLSSGEDPTGAVRVAWLTVAGTNRQWNKQASQQSQSIYLEGRRRYYLEALMQQGESNDHLAVRWQHQASGVYEEPLSTTNTLGTLLVPYSGTQTLPTVGSQPVGVTNAAGLGAMFSVFVTNRAPVVYQWLQNGTNLPGATKSVLSLVGLARSMSGSTFRCVLSNAVGTVTSAVAILSVPAAPSFGLYREYWPNLTNSLGNTLNALTNPIYNVNWPTNPAIAYTRYLTNFEAETTSGSVNYGQRIRTYVVPPTNGLYTFWVASDDVSQLSLSPDENPSNAVTIAYVVGSVASRAWTAQTNQRSAAIPLEKGRRYFLQGLMQQGAGGDNFAVRWQLPDGRIEEPLTATGTLGTVLVPYNGQAELPGLLQQPANTTLPENSEAVFVVLVTNRTPVYYQWTSNGVDVAGANAAGITISNATPAMNGIVYRCTVSNELGVVTSATATLTVLVDTNAPRVLRVFNVGSTNVRVQFSEPLLADDATNVANYAITNGGISVLSATVDVRGVEVTLTTTPLLMGQSYWMQFDGLRDRAELPNTIATNTTTNFQASAYAPADLGGTVASAILAASTNALTVSAGGGAIHGTSDQFSIFWQQRTGDFDVKVRLASVSLADAWSKAGLMVRSDLTATGMFAAAFGTPSVAGCYAQWRVTNSATAVMSGSVPVNFPNTWLRLRRTTNAFGAFASLDGANWMQMGAVTITGMPVTAYLGLAVSSHQTNGAMTTAQFAEIGEATAEPLGLFTLRSEPLGPSSRRTGLAFSEIMYNPAPRPDGRNLEFVELFNSQSIAEDLGGHRLSGDIDYVFPAGTVLKAGDFLVVARVPADVQAVYGLTNVLGPYTNGLPNGGGILRLRSELEAVLLEVAYEDKGPWPVSADGAGHALALSHASYGENDPRAWSASDTVGGTPGAWNSISNHPLDGVVINEFLAHTDPPLEDYVELYNHNNSAADLSGCWLSDTAGTNLYRIPDGTVITGRGFAVFTEAVLGFRLDALGEKVLLVNSNGTRVVDAVAFEAQENSVSMGRVPDGGAAFHRLASRTPAAANGARRLSDVVINELMYSPISGNADDQYVELHNRGSSNVDVSGWSFVSGVDFAFPSNTVIAAGGYLVVAKNAAHLMTDYPVLNAANCLGNFGGQLAGGGERIALAFPDDIVDTNGVTNVAQIVVADVTYEDGGRWGEWSDGGGSSLELIDPRADPRLPDSWADSDESGKNAPWATVEYTGPLMETVYSPVNDYLHLFLLGRGECLVDDVELLTNGISVTVTNGGFESGLSSWALLGAYDQSTVAAGGYSGAQCLHVRGSTRGDTGGNRIRSATFVPLAAGRTNITLRCKARWLRGWPELLLRMHGGSIEAAGTLPVPPDLGTPGLANSRLALNAPPSIRDVVHDPVLPQFGQSVVVAASADDPDGVAALTLRYRIDPAPGFTDVAMNDAGTGGDTVAGDGIYSATLPAQSITNLIAFHIRAVDQAGATGTYPRALFPTGTPVRLFPSDSVSRELLVRWGDTQMAGGFASYHLWMTATNRGRWQYRDRLNNAVIDGSFVYNNVRAIHGVGMAFGGSPFHLGNMDTGPDGGDRNDYNALMPKDDQLLGVTDLTFVAPGNAGGSGTSDTAGTAEQIAYEIFRGIGVPYLHRRYIHLFFNGSQRSVFTGVTGNFVYEDAQQPNSAYLEQWYPGNADGYLHKIEDWFEFNTTGTAFGNNDADFTRRVITGTTNLNVAAYRFMFRPRALGPGESANDYSAVAQLVNAISPTTINTNPLNFDVINDVVNLEGWFREMACQRTIGNYDSYGWDRGKNNFFYWEPGGRCELLPWDADQILYIPGSRPPTATIYGGNGDTRAIQMQSVPPIQRFYHRAFRDILDGPLQAGYLEGLLDERAAALTANGCGYSVASLTTQKVYVAARRNYLETELARIQTNFAVASPTNNAVVSSNQVTLTGTAPIQVADITVNGALAPITWVSSNRWSLTLALDAGSNTFTIVGVDRQGVPATNATPLTFTLVYGGTTVSPTGAIVFSEFLPTPAVTNAGYVELFNTSSNMAFDLGNWSVNGIGFTLPPGTVIAPRQQLLIVDDRYTFAQTFGTSAVPVGEYSGNLDPDGETLSLLMDDVATTVVDRVRYEAVAPWPLVTNGASLQLVVPTNDNSRVSNWAVGQTNPPSFPQWVYIAATGTVSGSTFYLYLGSAGDIYVDDVRCVLGTVDAGASVVSNGDFEAALTGPWALTANFASSSISTSYAHSGTASLHIVATAAGSGGNNAIIQTNSPGWTNGAAFLISLWYLQNTNGAPLVSRLTGNGTVLTVPNPAFTALPNFALNTPGASNSVGSSWSAYPAAWLNEVQGSNDTVVVDNAGQREPWVELYNAGTGPLSLAGLYLSDDYANPTKWAFPTNATIPSNGFRVVWCDAQTNQAATNAWHASFRLPPGAGRVVLSRVVTGTPQVVDYLNYTNVPVNWSFGDLPDGQPFYRRLMYVATPAGTNNGEAAPATVAINEWMADNASTPDPADGNLNEDWIELYNYGTQAVFLAGFYLTDDLGDPDKWAFPTNAVIPAGGFLVVWADDETNQNAIANGDLHASFKLSKGGEAIGLFSPSRVAVQTVTFGVQGEDLTEGRWPDAGGAIYPLAVPTPRSSNIVATNNAVAVFTNSAAWYAEEMTNFSMMISATDTDTPLQTLSYAMSAAPAGASLDPATGRFQWSPTESDGPGTNVFNVTVTDNGWPQRTATQAITLVVAEVNRAPIAGLPTTLLTYPGSPSELGLAPPSDADLPANTFVYSLPTNAPAGATLDPILGLIRWTPPDWTADSVVTVAVRIVDSGSPALAATATARFAIGPSSALFLGELGLDAGGPHLRWSAASGDAFRVESAGELPAAFWQLLTNSAAESNGYIVISDPSAATNPIRFYRIIRSP